MASAAGATEAKPPPEAPAALSGQWGSAAHGGQISASDRAVDPLAVEVLPCDRRADPLRLLAYGATVDDAVAAAEEHAAQRFGSDYAYCDWRAR